MSELFPTPREAMEPQALYFHFEKAGLTVHDQAIPWNADAVIVEALVKPASRPPSEFQVVVPGLPPISAESMSREANGPRLRLKFRLAPPTQSTEAVVRWREKSLGQLTLPMISCDEFLQKLRAPIVTLAACIGDRTVACQTIVARQCRAVIASAVLTSPTSLVPLLDLGLCVEVITEPGPSGDGGVRLPVSLTGTQLMGRHALATALLDRPLSSYAAPSAKGTRPGARKAGGNLATSVAWFVGDRQLSIERVRTIPLRTFQRSLRVCSTRYVVQSAKEAPRLYCQLPDLNKGDRVGPCFLVASSEPGMAGLCTFQVLAQVRGQSEKTLLEEMTVMIMDGPTLVAPGTIPGAEIENLLGFELRHAPSRKGGKPGTVLGVLPTGPAPAASFTSEGGFQPTDDYIWTPSAEQELSERLGKLLGGS